MGYLTSALVVSDYMDENSRDVCADLLQTSPFAVNWRNFSPVVNSSLLWLRGNIAWPKGSKSAKDVLHTPSIVPPKTFNGLDLRDCLLKGWSPKDASQNTISVKAFSASPPSEPHKADLVVHKSLKPEVACMRD